MSEEEISIELERLEMAIIKTESRLWRLQQAHMKLTGKTYHK